jgi:hypothetical protein
MDSPIRRNWGYLLAAMTWGCSRAVLAPFHTKKLCGEAEVKRRGQRRSSRALSRPALPFFPFLSLPFTQACDNAAPADSLVRQQLLTKSFATCGRSLRSPPKPARRHNNRGTIAEMKQPHYCPAEDPEATPAARQEKPQWLHAACRPPRNHLRTEKVLVALLFRGCGVVSKGIISECSSWTRFGDVR